MSAERENKQRGLVSRTLRAVLITPIVLLFAEYKAVGAVLLAALALVEIHLLGDFIYAPEQQANAANEIQVAATHEAANGDETVELVVEEVVVAEDVAVVASPQSVAERVAAADAAAGQAASGACQGCHTFDPDGAARVGPNLYGVIGDPIAGSEGFAYSTALTEIGGTWTYDAMDGFLASPRDFAPGTRMGFGGIGDAQDRANLIAYLRANDSDPAPLP